MCAKDWQLQYQEKLSMLEFYGDSFYSQAIEIYSTRP